MFIADQADLPTNSVHLEYEALRISDFVLMT